MQGRYGGNDKLNLFLLGAFLVLIVIAALLQLRILDIPAFLVLIYAYYRILSKNELLKIGSSSLAWKKFLVYFKVRRKRARGESIEFFRVLSAVKSCAFQKVTAR